MQGMIPFGFGEHNLTNFFDEFERRFWGDMIPQSGSFRTDIVENDGEYVLSADLPGFEKENIKIDIDRDMLLISAKKEENVEEKKDNYVRRERHYGTFSRRFDLSGIDADHIRAAYENGVLTLHLPKQQHQLPPSRQIEIQ